MVTIYNFKDRYNILFNNEDNDIYIKFVDTSLFCVYEENFSPLILQELNCCQSMDKLYLLIKSSFENKKNYTIKINHQKNKIILFFNIIFNDFYSISFKLNLQEQKKTSDKQNQLEILSFESKFEQMIKNLQSQITCLKEQTISLKEQANYNEKVFQEASICIGTCNSGSPQIHIPLNIPKLSFANNNHSSNNELNGDINKSNLTVLWDKIKFLPKLTDLTVNYNNNGYKLDGKFNDYNNNKLTNLTLINYPHATLENIDKIPTLKELIVQGSNNLKNASDYIKNSPNLKKITFTGCEGIKVNDSAQLNNLCRQKNILLYIN